MNFKNLLKALLITLVLGLLLKAVCSYFDFDVYWEGYAMACIVYIVCDYFPTFTPDYIITLYNPETKEQAYVTKLVKMNSEKCISGDKTDSFKFRTKDDAIEFMLKLKSCVTSQYNNYVMLIEKYRL
jgi:hypothetical protein